VFRFLPTFTLGIVMALLTVGTRSVFPAMVYHMTYNGLAILVSGSGDEMPVALTGGAAWAGSLALLGAGFVLLRAFARREGRTIPA
jgi:membrane protease YdiL (CAAX protease family)